MNEFNPSWEREVRGGERFRFGENWASFLRLLNEDRIRRAEESLKGMLELERLDGKRFVDVGSGSGVFSLAARRLGAEVVSFDYDEQSVACTAELKQRHFPDDPHWEVTQASVLDRDFLKSVGTFDVVYSWGVLHHTGRMWEALANVVPLVTPGGQLFIAIYNDQGRATRTWARVKKAYVAAPRPFKWAVLWPAFVRLWGPTILRDTIRGQPRRTWMSYSEDNSGRGMDPWRDVVDWVGGYPFEAATPEQIFDFFREQGFDLTRLSTSGGSGCNEFVFVLANAQV